MKREVSVTSLVDQMGTGAQRPLARLISMVERDDPAVPTIMQRLHPRLVRPTPLVSLAHRVVARVRLSTD